MKRSLAEAQCGLQVEWL